MFLYGYDAFVKFRGWRAGQLAQGERKVTQQSASSSVPWSGLWIEIGLYGLCSKCQKLLFQSLLDSVVRWKYWTAEDCLHTSNRWLIFKYRHGLSFFYINYLILHIAIHDVQIWNFKYFALHRYFISNIFLRSFWLQYFFTLIEYVRYLQWPIFCTIGSKSSRYQLAFLHCINASAWCDKI